MPEFNSTLDHTDQNLVLKNYYHLGIAVDTPFGLTVPVVRDVDQKSIIDLSSEYFLSPCNSSQLSVIFFI